jgi:nicotinamidase-related amidase
MSSVGLLHPAQSTLVVIDIQERLMPVIHEAERVFANANRILAGARLLGVHTLLTEQYPKGLGRTCSEIALDGEPVLEKMSFSCMLDESVRNSIPEGNKLVLCGVEAHICVLKTALDALDSGREVHVLADAVSSRTPQNHHLALERLRQAGAFIASTEMVLFQWLDYAGTDAFRAVSKLIK